MDPREKWDAIYAHEDKVAKPDPAWVLNACRELLPGQGTCIDIASGLGGNAIYLAGEGYSVTAMDISSAATEKLQHYANNHSLDINAVVTDITAEGLAACRADLITNFHYLDRQLFPVFETVLNPGGVLVFQTFVEGKVANIGPSSKRFLLAPDELASAFPGLTVLKYLDESANPDATHPLAGRACVIARKED